MEENDLPQGKNVILYTSTYGNAERLYQRLRDAGLNPILSEPFEASDSSGEEMIYYTAGSVLVRRYEFEKTKMVISGWESADDVRMNNLMKASWGQEVPYILLSFIIALIAGVTVLIIWGVESIWWIAAIVVWFLTYYYICKARNYIEEQKNKKQDVDKDEDIYNQDLQT